MTRYNRLRQLRGGLLPRAIENDRWTLYPVDDARRWALAHRQLGGLIENLNSADMLGLIDLLLMLDNGRETSEVK